MSLAAVDPQLSESARLIALGKLSSVYDTTTWVDTGTTPRLVRAAISMLVAAWEYQRAYGEEEDSTYGRRRERQAYDLLDGIVNGDITLEEYPEIGAESGTPVFYPNDLSNASEVYDAMDNYIASNDDVKFRMSGSY